MRARPHHHPCSRCGAKTECCGEIEQNWDGEPEFVCREYHAVLHYVFGHREDFICEACDAEPEGLPC